MSTEVRFGTSVHQHILRIEIVHAAVVVIQRPGTAIICEDHVAPDDSLLRRDGRLAIVVQELKDEPVVGI